MDYHLKRLQTAEDLSRFAPIVGPQVEHVIDLALGPALRGCGLIVGAETNSGQAVGVTWGQQCADPRVLYVPFIIVAPSERGKGLFGLLDRELQRHAVEEGYLEAFGLAARINHSSNSALRKNGWHEMGWRSDFYLVGGRTVLYYRSYLDAGRCRPGAGSPFWDSVLVGMRPADEA